MNIPIILNGEKTFIQTSPDKPLIDILRDLGFLSVKTGCEKGCCGFCTVLLNERPIPACKIPAALASEQKIITLEHFSSTQEYQDILKGFDKAGIHLCGYCNAGKIFAAWKIITSKAKPTRNSVSQYVKHLSPCCTDLETFINGIIYAFDIHNNKGEL